MADFRRWIYALAVVALLAGFTVPASAQTPPFVCATSVSVAPIVRAEGYTELVGDIVLSCNGGAPTLVDNPVPQVNFTVFLNTNITSKVTSAFQFSQNVNSFNPNFNEALLLFDEPNSPLRAPLPVNPILNCGNTPAPDTGPSGPGVCAIRATSNPALTYDGTPNGYGGAGAVVCDGTGAIPVANSYGCGRPNIFQGRQGTPQNPSQFNAVSFLGVPLDPPGTTTNRTIRITNIRANAVGIGVSSTFTTSQIQANISVNGPTTLSISNPQVIVAYVNRGLTVDIPTLFSSRGGSRSALRNRLDFVQCQPENPDLHVASSSTASPVFSIPQYNTGGQSANYFAGVDQSPLLRFQEGFASSWKTRNIAHTIGSNVAGNGLFFPANNTWAYGGFNMPPGNPPRNNPTDLAQNVPGTVYNTESGFMWPSQAAVPPTNPPPGFGFQPVGSNGMALNSVYTTSIYPTGTGVASAGVPSQATRLSVSLSNVPSGASVWVAPVLYLFRQGSTYALSNTPDPSVVNGGVAATGGAAGVTGVMVLVSSTDSAGAGGTVFSSASTPLLAKVGTNNLIVYEVLYTDPYSLEIVDVPIVVAYQSNPGQNLPTPGITTQGTGGFAPFYSTSAAGLPQLLSGAGQPSGSLPVPRFIPGSGPKDLFLISKCACNLLFPYVVSAAGYDTGIAIANTSADPGATYGFSGVPQPGTITFWYYGEMASGGAVPGPQTSKSVPAGQVLTYVASSGSAQWGLDGRAAGLIGYVISQSQFQYCHALAYISALGAGPLTPGTSEAYLGIVLDAASLNRTNQVGENKAH